MDISANTVLHLLRYESFVVYNPVLRIGISDSRIQRSSKINKLLNYNTIKLIKFILTILS